MPKYCVVIGFVVLAALTGGSVLWSSSGSAHSSQRAFRKDGQTNPLVAINQKARAAKDAGEAATREVVEEMFRSSDFAQEFAELDDAIKDRLFRAELNHRNNNGKSSGSEFRVVHAVNLLGDRLGTPAYTRTNVFEVRRLRANLLPYMSDISGGRRSPKENGKAQKASNQMSPLETFFVAVMLIQQKRHNPEYQLTNEEWIALHAGERSAAANKKFNDEMQRRSIDSKRTVEVRQSISAGLMNMSPFDMLELPEVFLNTLGIER